MARPYYSCGREFYNNNAPMKTWVLAVGSSQWGGAGHYPVLTDREAEAAAARHKSDWLMQEAFPKGQHPLVLINAMKKYIDRTRVRIAWY